MTRVYKGQWSTARWLQVKSDSRNKGLGGEGRDNWERWESTQHAALYHVHHHHYLVQCRAAAWEDQTQKKTHCTHSTCVSSKRSREHPAGPTAAVCILETGKSSTRLSSPQNVWSNNDQTWGMAGIKRELCPHATAQHANGLYVTHYVTYCTSVLFTSELAN